MSSQMRSWSFSFGEFSLLGERANTNSEETGSTILRNSTKIKKNSLVLFERNFWIRKLYIVHRFALNVILSQTETFLKVGLCLMYCVNTFLCHIYSVINYTGKNRCLKFKSAG